jgi:hypothetical protein
MSQSREPTRSWWNRDVRLGVLVLLCGCRQMFGIDDVTLRDDGGGTDQPFVYRDAPADVAAGSCVARWIAGPSFGAPQPLTNINTISPEDDAFISHDQKSLYFSVDGEIWVSTRATVDAMFGSPAKESSLSSTTGSEYKVYVNVDGTRAFFSSDRTGGDGGIDLWRGARGQASGSWSTDQSYVDKVNDVSNQDDPFLSLDLLRIYLAPTSASGQHIVMYSRANTNQSFDNKVTLTELQMVASAYSETDPTLTDDERVIVFSTSRSGGTDLWYATRADRTLPFGAPQQVPTINDTTALDAGASITGDGCFVYFSSTRTGGGDLFVAQLL